MKPLNATEIEKFASKTGVRRIAVENFLGTLDTIIGYSGNASNMYRDAKMYKWNSATQNAILAGIRLAAKG